METYRHIESSRSLLVGFCAVPVLQDVLAQQLSPTAPAGGGLNEEVSSPGSACSFPAVSSAVPGQTVYNVQPLFSCHVETFTRSTHAPAQAHANTHRTSHG